MFNLRNILSLASLMLAALTIEALAAEPKMDFNGDGVADLAIASPYATVDTKPNAGIVTVIYGNNALPTQIWRYDRVSSYYQESANDNFGSALAAGDFNGDGVSDLAIGIPRTNSNPPKEGAVVILHGSRPNGSNPGGLKGWGVSLAPKYFTMPTPKPHDQFGSALAAADFDGLGYADLAVGAPNYTYGLAGAGAVLVLRGDSNGLTTNNQQFFYDFLGAQPNAAFGFSLVAGNFGKSAHIDLAIGAPFRDSEPDINFRVDDGAIEIIFGSSIGLYPNNRSDGGGGLQWRDQSDAYFANDGPERSDFFGWALAAGDFGNPAGNGVYDDLAVGIPNQEVLGVVDAGSVTVFYGSSTGLSQYEQWNFGNLVGQHVSGDKYGSVLIAGNFGYDGQADLAVGVPYHPVVGLTGAGVVSIIFGTPTGLSAANSNLVHMNTSSQPSGWFGGSLSTAQFGGDGYLDLAIGAPRWNVSGLSDAGAVSIRYGSPTGPNATTSDQWKTAVAPAQGARFGFAIAK